MGDPGSPSLLKAFRSSDHSLNVCQSIVVPSVRANRVAALLPDVHLGYSWKSVVEKTEIHNSSNPTIQEVPLSRAYPVVTV